MAKDLFERDYQLKQLIMTVTKFIEALKVYRMGYNAYNLMIVTICSSIRRE